VKTALKINPLIPMKLHTKISWFVFVAYGVYTS